MNNNIGKYFIYVFFLTFTFASCEDDNVGEFKLTGAIEQLIPEDTYDLKKTITSDERYIVFTPTLNSNFDYWGLTLKQVEYYIDDILYSTESQRTCELIIDKTTLATGKHTLKAMMMIVGEKCNDTFIEKSCEFLSSNYIQEIHGDFYMDYNYVTTGDYLTITPELLASRSSEGCAIDKVEYYWDNTLIASTTTAPFNLTYKVNDEVGTTHDIEVRISYHDNKNSSLSYNWTLDGYKVLTKDDYSLSWSIKSMYNHYTNGEILSIAAKLFKGDNVDQDSEIEFYLDDRLIGKSSYFPYTLDYKLSNETIGTHTIKVEKKYSNAPSVSLITNTVIVITK